MFNFLFSRKLCRLLDNVEKCGIANEARNIKIIRSMRLAICITMLQTNTQNR